MEKILIKILREEVSYDVKNRGKRHSPFGKRVPANITLPEKILGRAKEIARQRKMSLSRLFELWLMDLDRVYQKALLDVLKADETLDRSWEKGKTSESDTASGTLSEEFHRTLEKKKGRQDPHVPQIATEEPSDDVSFPQNNPVWPYKSKP